MIAGFDLGNSPGEFTREASRGRTMLIATTNGTGAFAARRRAREVLVGSFVNYTAVAAMLRARARAKIDLAIVCAGRERQFSLEDAVCAGRYVHVVRSD